MIVKKQKHVSLNSQKSLPNCKNNSSSIHIEIKMHLLTNATQNELGEDQLLEDLTLNWLSYSWPFSLSDSWSCNWNQIPGSCKEDGCRCSSLPSDRRLLVSVESANFFFFRQHLLLPFRFLYDMVDFVLVNIFI